MPRVLEHRQRGHVARASFFAVLLLLAGCATPPKGDEMSILPSPQRQPTHQVVGDAIVASLGGVAVRVQWLPASGVEQYFAGKPGLVYPWPKEVWKLAPPTVFFVRIRNQTPEEVQFDPTSSALVTQGGRREPPVSYEEMYQRLEEAEGSEARLQSLQATLLSRFLVISPGGEREGLLVFPTVGSDTKHLLLEFSSFFVGGRNVAGLFEFQVLRQKTE
jgi:hypothetical protein